MIVVIDCNLQKFGDECDYVIGVYADGGFDLKRVLECIRPWVNTLIFIIINLCLFIKNGLIIVVISRNIFLKLHNILINFLS